MAPPNEDPFQRSSHLYLTTVGRRSGQLRSVELWFAYSNDQVYLLAHPRPNRRGTHWYRNLRANPECILEIRGRQFVGRAMLPDNIEDLERTAALFRAKYGPAAYEAWYGDAPRLPVIVRLEAKIAR